MITKEHSWSVRNMEIAYGYMVKVTFLHSLHQQYGHFKNRQLLSVHPFRVYDQSLLLWNGLLTTITIDRKRV